MAEHNLVNRFRLDHPKWGHSLAVDLAKEDLGLEASEHYKDFVVRSKLRKVGNKAVKRNAFARLEEFWRFPCRHIESVKAPDERVLRSNRDIREAFRAHFRDRFARLPDLPIQEFHCYLADFPKHQEAKTAGCKNGWLRKRLVAEYEVRDALKQVGLKATEPSIWQGFPLFLHPCLGDHAP